MMGAPHWGCATCLTQAQEAQLAEAGVAWAQGCKDTNFPISLYITVCRNMDIYITTTPKAKEKIVDRIAWSHGDTGWAKF
jgi:hypothetical protein